MKYNELQYFKAKTPETNEIRVRGMLFDNRTGVILAASCVYLLLFIFFKNHVFTHFTGALSGTIESLLPFPQFYMNYKRKSVYSLR